MYMRIHTRNFDYDNGSILLGPSLSTSSLSLLVLWVLCDGDDDNNDAGALVSSTTTRFEVTLCCCCSPSNVGDDDGDSDDQLMNPVMAVTNDVT